MRGEVDKSTPKARKRLQWLITTINKKIMSGARKAFTFQGASSLFLEAFPYGPFLQALSFRILVPPRITAQAWEALEGAH